MDRNLEIAMAAGLVALILIYAIFQRLRDQDFGGMTGRRIKRDDASVRFWAVIAILVVAVTGFGTLAVWHLVSSL